MNNSEDLPIEVIRAIKQVCNYIADAGYTDAQITYIGTVKFLKPDNTARTISPIALDMMHMRQSSPKEAQ